MSYVSLGQSELAGGEEGVADLSYLDIRFPGAEHPLVIGFKTCSYAYIYIHRNIHTYVHTGIHIAYTYSYKYTHIYARASWKYVDIWLHKHYPAL